MSARFTALVTGFPEPQFEFFFKGQPLYPTDRIHMKRERTGLIRLSLAFVEESDIGTYGLRVSPKFWYTSLTSCFNVLMNDTGVERHWRGLLRGQPDVRWS